MSITRVIPAFKALLLAAWFKSTTNGLAGQIVSGNLSSVVGGNGRYGPVGQYPTQTFQSTNYFRDIVFNPSGGAASRCDVNASGATDVVDVQLAVNQALGGTCTADINGDGRCDVVDVQRVVNAALGGLCVSP